MTIGERIKRRRLKLGMSQEELAHRLGYKSRSSINKIELGGQNLTQTKIKRIADALETTPEYIMGWDSKKEQNEDYIFLDAFIRQADDDELRDLRKYAEFLRGR